jgi:hypothetical protein
MHIFGDDFIEEGHVSIEVGDKKMPGHYDGKISSLDCVLEVKTIGKFMFDKVKESGQPLVQHYEQANIYAHGTKARWILFMYYNRDNGDYTLMMLPYNKSLAKSTINKMNYVFNTDTKWEKIERPYNNATNAPCYYCELKDKCYDGYSNEIADLEKPDLSCGGFIPSEYMNVVGLCISLDHVNNERLDRERRVDDLKTKIVTELNRMNLKGLKLKDADGIDINLTMTVGKNNNPLISNKIKETKK